MADVYIASPPMPEIIDETWPPKPAEPVRTDAPRAADFAPAPPPILNADAAVILGLGPQHPPNEDMPSSISVGSTEISFVPAGAPISNEGTATIFGQRVGPSGRPSEPVNPNKDVTFFGAPAMENNSQAFIPPPPEVRSSGMRTGDVINAGQGDVQILSGGPPLNVNGDVTIGGGGDMTKAARSEEISFFGRGGTIDVGSTEVFQAPSGEQLKTAGAEDKTLTPNFGSLGNQETYEGAIGEPTANPDHLHGTGSSGARGKPKNVKG
jgi:hypothetical protein